MDANFVWTFVYFWVTTCTCVILDMYIFIFIYIYIYTLFGFWGHRTTDLGVSITCFTQFGKFQLTSTFIKWPEIKLTCFFFFTFFFLLILTIRCDFQKQPGSIMTATCFSYPDLASSNLSTKQTSLKRRLTTKLKFVDPTFTQQLPGHYIFFWITVIFRTYSRRSWPDFCWK